MSTITLEDLPTLRKTLCQQRAQLTEAVLHQHAHALAEHVLNSQNVRRLRPRQRVSGYLAIRGEMTLHPVFEALRARNIEIYLPVLRDGAMYFAPWAEGAALRRCEMGLYEPNVHDGQLCKGTSMDLVLAPLVAVDQSGNRLGMGGGYYDRAFAHRLNKAGSPFLLGIAHMLQQVSQLPVQPWDVPLDALATEAGIQQWASE